MRLKFKKLVFAYCFLLLTVTGLVIAVYLVQHQVRFKPQASENDYDVVVVGAGSGGISAAIQAARLGSRVALIEETGMIGGQLITVPNMDEGMSQARNSGIYAEFANKINNYYSQQGKSTSTCYWSSDSLCFEPKAVLEILNQMIADEPNIDLILNTKVTKALATGNKVEGVVTNDGKIYKAKVTIDATEYGDVIPLTPAKYRVGNSTSDAINQNACIQDITYTATVTKYPQGASSELIINNPPPKYEEYKDLFSEKVASSGASWYIDSGKYPADWITHNSYRGLPDSLNPNNYTAATREQAANITKTGINWANDYPATNQLSVKYLEDKTFRTQVNCEAKLKTLNFVYYLQQQFDKNWSLSTNEGFSNFDSNQCPNIPAEYNQLLTHFPPLPYIRESIRIVPIYTLTAGDIKRTGSPLIAQKLFKSSIAVGYYHNDLHNCKENENLESGLESRSDVPETWTVGPFQVPIESLIPETVNGFLAAEKNIGVTRLVNGATRLQPITMLTGQAAGALAAVSVKDQLELRDVKPAKVQAELIKAGDFLSVYDFKDVPKGHPYWDAVQMISTHKIMIGYSPEEFGVDNNLTRAEMATVLGNYLDLDRTNPPATPSFVDVAKDIWYYKHIEAIFKEGLTAGCQTDPPKYCPDDPLTREQMAVFAVRLVHEEPYSGIDQSFADVPVDKWSHKWVSKATHLGLMQGYSDNTFKPEEPIKRGKVSEIFNNILLYEKNTPTPPSLPSPSLTPTPTPSLSPSPSPSPSPSTLPIASPSPTPQLAPSLAPSAEPTDYLEATPVKQSKTGVSGFFDQVIGFIRNLISP